MVKFTQEMKEGLRVPGKGGSLVYLCTSSRDGNPNIAAMRFVATHMDDKILIADMFLLKTKANIKENPNVAVAICHPLDEGRWWVFRGKAVDVSPDSITVEATGGREKLEALLEMLRPFGIIELVQSGQVALGRGPRSITDKSRS